MKRIYCVYRHMAPNGKVYIGITGTKPSKRWNNGNGYKSQTLFYRAILKYGWDNFCHDILAYGLTQQEAEDLEFRLISAYNAKDSDFGYNLADGGGIHSGWHQSEVTKKIISEAGRGRAMPDSACKKLCGHRKPPREKPENRYLYSEENYRNSVAFNQEYFGRKVRCIDTGRVYPSVRSAAESVGAKHQNISACCAGKQRFCAGYRWEYVA